MKIAEEDQKLTRDGASLLGLEVPEKPSREVDSSDADWWAARSDSRICPLDRFVAIDGAKLVEHPHAVYLRCGSFTNLNCPMCSEC